jgi:hypothetical protein
VEWAAFMSAIKSTYGQAPQSKRRVDMEVSNHFIIVATLYISDQREILHNYSNTSFRHTVAN